MRMCSYLVSSLLNLSGCILLSDINECELLYHECHQNATCYDSLGSYHCQCNNGFYGDGRACNLIGIQLYQHINVNLCIKLSISTKFICNSWLIYV